MISKTIPIPACRQRPRAARTLKAPATGASPNMTETSLHRPAVGRNTRLMKRLACYYRFRAINDCMGGTILKIVPPFDDYESGRKKSFVIGLLALLARHGDKREHENDRISVRSLVRRSQRIQRKLSSFQRGTHRH